MGAPRRLFPIAINMLLLRCKALKEGSLRLKCGEAEGAVEFAVEFVVFAECHLHYPLQLFDVVHIHYRIHVVEKRGVSIEGA